MDKIEYSQWKDKIKPFLGQPCIIEIPNRIYYGIITSVVDYTVEAGGVGIYLYIQTPTNLTGLKTEQHYCKPIPIILSDLAGISDLRIART